MLFWNTLYNTLAAEVLIFFCVLSYLYHSRSGLKYNKKVDIGIWQDLQKDPYGSCSLSSHS